MELQKSPYTNDKLEGLVQLCLDEAKNKVRQVRKLLYKLNTVCQ